MKRTIVVGLIIMAGWVLPAAAAQRIGVEAGGAFPTGANDFSDTAKPGLLSGVHYLYSLSPKISVGGGVNYMLFGKKKHGRTAVKELETETSAINIEALGRYDLPALGKFVPYAKVGLGATRYQEEVTTRITVASAVPNSSVDEDSWAVGGSLGAGIELPLSDSYLVGLAATWHFLGASDSKFGTPVVNVPSAALQFAWKFGE